MNRTLIAHLSLFSAQLIYALNYSIAKDLMPQSNGPVAPLALVWMRIAGACLLFWSAGFFVKEKVETKDRNRLLLMAAFGVAINQGFFIYGLSLTEPINSAIIMISSPISVLIFTLIAFREKITIFKIGGIGLGVCGALILLLFNKGFSFGSQTMLGDLFTFVNSLSWAIFLVIARPMLQKYHVITVMKWIFLIGFIYFLPVGTYDFIHVKWDLFSSKLWFALAFVVIATTFFAYLLNTYALKELSSTVVATYIYIQPFLASLIAVMWGKDELYAKKVIAGLLIVAGVWLVSKKSQKEIKTD
ncbi:MAG: DMT family transporter [Bacteroidota bacterium]|jgi:drug/metabolite transporter (DMT)-like permease